MSAYGTKRTSRPASRSAFGGKADITWDVRRCPLLTQSGRGRPPLCATNGTAYSANPNALVNAGELFRLVN